MYMTPYLSLFREQAAHETRVLTTISHPLLPDDEYGLLEYYCTDPECDCQMVMLQVHPASDPNRNLASICYVFDPTEDMITEPILDLTTPASPYAHVLLELVKPILADPDYAARIQAHYRQVKNATSRPRRLRSTKPLTAGLPTKPRSPKKPSRSPKRK